MKENKQGYLFKSKNSIKRENMRNIIKNGLEKLKKSSYHLFNDV
jgi:hypothetical protein